MMNLQYIKLLTMSMEIKTLDTNKVEKIIKGRLGSIPSPLHSVKIQIIVGKVYLRK